MIAILIISQCAPLFLIFQQDIVDGNPKLNLAFVANLFNNFPALDLEEIEEEYEPYEENREEKSMKTLFTFKFIGCIEAADGHDFVAFSQSLN